MSAQTEEAFRLLEKATDTILEKEEVIMQLLQVSLHDSEEILSLLRVIRDLKKGERTLNSLPSDQEIDEQVEQCATVVSTLKEKLASMGL